MWRLCDSGLAKRSDVILNVNTRRPLVLYRSPECIGYAEQARKYMTICCISFRLCRSIRKQIRPCHKNGQGQPSVIIWTNLVVLEYAMCIPSFKVISLLVPKKEIFEDIYHIWDWVPSWSCDLDFHPNIPWRLHMKCGFKWPRVFFIGKEVLKCI